MARDPLKYGKVDDGLEDELDFAPAAEAPADEPVAADEAPAEPEAPEVCVVSTGGGSIVEEVYATTAGALGKPDTSARAKLLTMGQ
jgi:hypothetical protein